MANLRAFLLLFIAGAVWGGIALGLGSGAFGPGIWAGVLLSPLIGLTIGILTQAAFERCTGLRRWLVALGSLYLGGTLFGLTIGIAESLRRGLEWPRFTESILEGVVAVWWGITFTGFLLVLWPAAYLTHAFLAWESER